MNPKIKELMIESGMIAKSNLNGVMWTTNMSVTTAEKFAELIIRECADVELYWLSEQDRKAVSDKINEHFWS